VLAEREITDFQSLERERARFSDDRAAGSAGSTLIAKTCVQPANLFERQAQALAYATFSIPAVDLHGFRHCLLGHVGERSLTRGTKVQDS
jgi:hypothetical protein